MKAFLAIPVLNASPVAATPLGAKMRRRLSPREILVNMQARKLAFEVLQTVDLEGFNAMKRGALKRVRQAIDLKYFYIQGHLTYSMKRAIRLGLHASNAKRVLDIGTGFGYFPYICEYFGHAAFATDIEGHQLYDEMTEFFGIRKIHAAVDAFAPLPAFDGRFDLVTAHLVAFNRPNMDGEWGPAEWAYFIDDVFENQLLPGGRLYLELNVIDRFNGWYSPETAALFEARGARVNGDRVLFQKA